MSLGIKAHWQAIRLRYRRRVFGVLEKIENGSVSQDDLDKLRNFCAVAVMLMGKVQEPVWRKAERDAETAAWLRGAVDDKWEEEDVEEAGCNEAEDGGVREEQPRGGQH